MGSSSPLVQRYDPSLDTNGPVAPPVLLTATRFGGVDRLLEKAPEIPWKSRLFVAQFTGLTFRDPEVVMDKVRGDPVYLILAMTGDKLLRFKPQNLVTGLPVRRLETVA